MAHAIGVDLGGTKTAAGVVSEDGELLFSETAPTLSRAGGEAVLDATAALVAGLRARAQADGLSIAGVGVGSAGVIDAGRGVVVSATDAIQRLGRDRADRRPVPAAGPSARRGQRRERRPRPCAR